MTELLRFVLLGLAVGAVYALTAHGLVLIHRGAGIVSFCQGALGMVGAYLFYELEGRGWPAVALWTVAVGTPAVLGVTVQAVIMTRLRQASPLVRLASTLGVLFLLVAVGEKIWGEHYRVVESPLPTTPRYPFGGSIALGEDRLWLIAIAVVVTGVLSAAFRWSRFGHAVEAVADNPVAAASLGLSPGRIAAVNWALGSALAAVAGVFVAPFLSLSVTILSFTVLRALAAALVGRFRSFWLTLGGAMLIGVIESVLGRYVEDKGVLGPLTSADGRFLGLFTAQSVSRSAAFIVVIALLIRSGRGLPVRGELLDRLPALGTGRVRGSVVAALTAAMALLLLFVLPDSWGSAFIVSMSVAIVCLSVVVVTGFAGQLSLAQMALAGFAAWAAGRLVDAHGWPVLAAGLVAVGVTVLVGVLTAIPALRTRGMTLAILSFGLSVVISELVLRNSGLTGDINGTRLTPPVVFGLEVDALNHPGRYALFVLAALVAAGLAVANLRRGRSGRRLIAVRSNERAAAALGIGVNGAKVFSFGLAAALAGLGGVLLAFRQGFLDYEAFEPFASIRVLVYSVIGGVGFVVGALFAGPLASGGIGGEIVRAIGFDPVDLEWFTGLVLVAILLSQPDGMASEHVRLARALGDRVRGRLRTASGPDGDVEAGPTDTAPLVRVGSGGPAAGLAAWTPVDRSGTALAVEHLTVRFGGVTALDDVSLDVGYGEIVGLIGPNGAGKTTLIDAVTGFVTCRPGVSLTLDGVGIEGWTPTRRARFGLARSFQSLELFEEMTVRENLLTACDDRAPSLYFRDLLRPGTAELSPAALAAVEEFQLGDALDRRPQELPHGRQRLVAIARAVAASPRVLLLDEPAAGLTEAGSRELGELIAALAHRAGLAVLLVEHDVSLVMSISDRIAVLDFGRLIAEGPPEAVAADPTVVAAYLGEPEADGHADRAVSAEGLVRR